MPIRWDAVAVDEALDRVAAEIKKAEPFLVKAHELAMKATQLQNLPQYIQWDLRRLTGCLDWDALKRPLREIESCRREIPQKDFELQRLQAGSKQGKLKIGG